MAIKTPEQQLVAINNVLAEEERIIKNRLRELHHEYARKESLWLESFQERFESQFGDQYRTAINDLNDCWTLAKTVQLHAADEDIESTVTYLDEKIDELRAMRSSSKDLRDKMRSFMDQHRSISSEMDLNEIAGSFSRLKGDVAFLREAARDQRFRHRHAAIATTIEAVEPLLHHPTSVEEITALSPHEVRNLQMVLVQTADDRDAVWHLRSSIWEEEDNRKDQQLATLFTIGEDSIKRQISQLDHDAEETEGRSLSDLLDFSHRLRQINSREYDGYEMDIDETISQMESLVRHIAEEQ